MSPDSPSFLVQSFLDATKYGYGYMCINFHQQTRDIISHTTNILPSELPIVVYVKKKHLKNDAALQLIYSSLVLFTKVW